MREGSYSRSDHARPGRTCAVRPPGSSATTHSGCTASPDAARPGGDRVIAARDLVSRRVHQLRYGSDRLCGTGRRGGRAAYRGEGALPPVTWPRLAGSARIGMPARPGLAGGGRELENGGPGRRDVQNSAREDELIRHMKTCSAGRASVPLGRTSAVPACSGAWQDYTDRRICSTAHATATGRPHGPRYWL
jgi:hypothetical protein